MLSASNVILHAHLYTDAVIVCVTIATSTLRKCGSYGRRSVSLTVKSLLNFLKILFIACLELSSLPTHTHTSYVLLRVSPDTDNV